MKYRQFLIGISFSWAGFLCAISAIEAWLILQAPGATLATEVNIVNFILLTTNKVEWLMALGSVLFIYAGGGTIFKRSLIILLPVLLLLLQSLWLFVLGDTETALQVSEEAFHSAPLPLCYLGAEVLKAVSLVLFAIKILK